MDLAPEPELAPIYGWSIGLPELRSYRQFWSPDYGSLSFPFSHIALLARASVSDMAMMAAFAVDRSLGAATASDKAVIVVLPSELP